MEFKSRYLMFNFNQNNYRSLVKVARETKVNDGLEADEMQLIGDAIYLQFLQGRISDHPCYDIISTPLL